MNSCTSTLCPVSSHTSRLAARRDFSFRFNLPFGSTQCGVLRNCTTATSSFPLCRNTSPPAAKTVRRVISRPPTIACPVSVPNSRRHAAQRERRRVRFRDRRRRRGQLPERLRRQDRLPRLGGLLLQRRRLVLLRAESRPAAKARSVAPAVFASSSLANSARRI